MARWSPALARRRDARASPPVLGALAAYISVRDRAARPRGWSTAVAVLPNALPGMVLAVGLILAWNRSWWPVPVYNTPFVLLLGYVCLLLPYPVRYVGAGLRQIGAVAGRGGAGQRRRHGADAVAHPAAAGRAHLLVAMPAGVRHRLARAGLLGDAGAVRHADGGDLRVQQFVQGSPGVGMALSVLAIFASTAVLVLLSRLGRTAVA